MNIVISRLEDTRFRLEDVLELLHESFQERLEQGLQYRISSMDFDTFKKDVSESVILCAVDSDAAGALVGVGTMRYYGTGKKYYAYIEYDAVSPSYKRRGIGSMLMRERIRIAREAGVQFIESDTSVKAGSAVKYHLKCGFKIGGYASFSSTNYYSYIFKMPIAPDSGWNSDCYRIRHFLRSFFKVRTSYKADGTLTRYGRWRKSTDSKI